MSLIEAEVSEIEARLARLKATIARTPKAATPKEGAGLVDERWAGRDSFSVSEAAQILGIAPATAYSAAQRGEIPTIRIGRILRVGRRALEKLLGD